MIPAKKILGIAWPAFLSACLLEVLLFGLFDPLEMLRGGQPVGMSRLALQTAAFFVFWLVCAASSAMTVLLTDNGAAASPWPPSPER